MHLPNDEGKRGHLAVAISVVDEGDRLVLFFDDLQLRQSGASRIWRHKKFVTTAVIPKEKLRTMAFSEEEAAGLGLTILGCLSAMYLPRP